MIGGPRRAIQRWPLELFPQLALFLTAVFLVPDRRSGRSVVDPLPLEFLFAIEVVQEYLFVVMLFRVNAAEPGLAVEKSKDMSFGLGIETNERIILDQLINPR